MKPWENEPDRLEFEYMGYPCIILRNKHATGTLCGYVGIPKEHSFYGKDYDDIDVEVHGGLTYSTNHKPLENEPDELWWLGFDCAHFDDFMPYFDDPESDYRKLLNESIKIFEKKNILSNLVNDIYDPVFMRYKTYKTVGFVKNEIRNLVKQLAEVSGEKK